MKVTIALSILLLLSALALSFLVVDYQGRLQNAGAVVEEQQTDLLTYSSEVSRLNSELNRRDTEVNQLGAELTTAQEEADYWEGKAHPRQFTSLEELKAWLAGNDIDKTSSNPQRAQSHDKGGHLRPGNQNPVDKPNCGPGSQRAGERHACP